jgi:hypothetical protein
VVQSASLEVLKSSHRSVTLRFSESRLRPPGVPGVLRWDGAGQDWTAVCSDGAGELHAAAAGWQAQIVEEREPSLDELFFAHVGIRAASEPDA